MDPYAEHQPLRTAPMPTNYRRAFAQGSAASPLDPQQLQQPQQQVHTQGDGEEVKSPGGGNRRKPRGK